MARPVRIEFPGALYHVVARGNERKAVFRDDGDRSDYLERLAHYGEDPGFRLLAYCLMDNHVRLATDIKMSDNDDPVLVIGQADDVDRFLRQMQLPARPSSIGNRGTAQVWTAKLSAGKPLLVVSARDAAALEALQRPLPHYGRQSWLVFDGSKAIDRGIWPAQAQAWQFE